MSLKRTLKKSGILLVAAVVSSLFCLSSCSGDNGEYFKEKAGEYLRGMFTGEEMPAEKLIYQDVGYVYSPYFYMEKAEEASLVFSSAYFFYMDHYYSGTNDDPQYLYESRCGYMYLREGFDYLSETFVIENTEIKISFSELFADFESEGRTVPGNTQEEARIVLCSESDPRFRTAFFVNSEDGKTYLIFKLSHLSVRKECSETFSELLEKQALLETR